MLTGTVAFGQVRWLCPFWPQLPQVIVELLGSTKRLHHWICLVFGCPILLSGCSGTSPADIVYLLDGSNSIDPKDFGTMLQFVGDMAEYFPISDKEIQVGKKIRGVTIPLLFLLTTLLSDHHVLNKKKMKLKGYVTPTIYPMIFYSFFLFSFCIGINISLYNP